MSYVCSSESTVYVSSESLSTNDLSSLEDDRQPNILITGSKCTGKSSVCKSLVLLLLKNFEFILFKYLDVNNYRTEFSDISLNYKLSKFIRNKLNEGATIIEDTKYEFYNNDDFHAIFILKTQDEVLEQRLINQGDFHTPYNDYHIMEPYNSICEMFPNTKHNKVFILENTLDSHILKNARFIKQFISEFMHFEDDKNKTRDLDSEGEDECCDSDNSDANETFVSLDAKFSYTD